MGNGAGGGFVRFNARDLLEGHKAARAAGRFGAKVPGGRRPCHNEGLLREREAELPHWIRASFITRTARPPSQLSKTESETTMIWASFPLCNLYTFPATAAVL